MPLDSNHGLNKDSMLPLFPSLELGSKQKLFRKWMYNKKMKSQIRRVNLEIINELILESCDSKRLERAKS